MSDEIALSSNITAGNQALLSDRSEVNHSLFRINSLIDNSFFFPRIKNLSNDLAVSVEGAWKSYGSWWKSTTALHDVTLRAPTGVM